MKKIIVEYLVSSQKTAILEDDKLIELLIEDTSINVLILQQPYSGIIASFLQTNFYQISKSKLTA